MTSWQVAPHAERQKLTAVEIGQQNWRRLIQQSTAESAANIALASELYPGTSPEVLFAADAAGIAAEAELMVDLAAEEHEQTGLLGGAAHIFDEVVWDPLKGTTRWLGMAFEGTYDEIISRPMRVATNMKTHGMGFEEAYRESGDAAFGAFGESIANLAQGQELNLGEGIFAQSELAPPTQEALAYVEELGASIGTENDQVSERMVQLHPELANADVETRRMIFLTQQRESIFNSASSAGDQWKVPLQDRTVDLYSAQSQVGMPTTQKIQSQADAVLFYSNALPWHQDANGGLGIISQVSPGRIYANVAMEPGSGQYHWASGTIDAGMQLGADPADFGLAAVAKGVRGARALGVTAEAAGYSTALRTAQDTAANLDEANRVLRGIEATGDLETLATKADVTQDAAVQLAQKGDLTDPRFAELQRLGRQRTEARHLRAEIWRMENEPTIAQTIKRQAGILGAGELGTRADVYGPSINKFLTGRTAQPFVENFVRANTLKAVDQLLSHVKTPIPRLLRQQLKNATTNKQVINLLLPQMGGVITESGLSVATTVFGGRGITGLAARGLGRLNPAVDARKAAHLTNHGWRLNTQAMYGHSALARRFAQVSPATMDLNDLDRAYGDLDLMTTNLKLDRSAEFTIPTVGKQTKVTTVDQVFDDFIGIQDGDFVEAFNVLDEYMKVAFASLSEQGVSKDVATAITRFTKGIGEEGLWFVNRVGDIVREPNAASKTLNNGAEIVNPGPQLITELFNGTVAMPDSNLIRRAVGDTDSFLGVRYAHITNNLVTRGADAGFESRVAVRAAQGVISNVWKPLVLLRFAWPFRVVGEEQLRMSGAGLGSVFTMAPGQGHHPLSYFAMMLGRRGMRDIEGDEFAKAEEFLSAMSRRANFDGEVGARGSTYWTSVQRGSGSYYDGLTTELNMLWSDPVVRELFSVDFADDIDRVGAVADWMRTGPGQEFLQQLTRNAPAETRELLSQPDGLRMYLEGVYARAHLKAGGEYRYLTGAGTFVDDSGRQGILSGDDLQRFGGNRTGYVITRPGHSEILDTYATGTLRGRNVSVRSSADQVKHIRSSVRDMVNNEAVEGVRFPQAVKGQRALQGGSMSELRKTYDSATEKLFDFFMTRPTNRLSRSPAFRDTYYQRVGELLPYMDEPTRKAALVAADAEDMGRIVRAQAKSAKASTKIDTAERLTSIKEVDDVAKSYALTQTEDLLYDLSKRHNVTAAMSIIFPFAEAYGEVASTWAKLMTNQWLRPLRRFQQVTEGAQDANPFISKSGYSNEGFFYDSVNGQEVFAAPFPIPGASGRLEYAVEGMNIVNNIIPGFGPAVQIPANLFLPDDPQWDEIREMISPFGGEGNILSSSLPSYMKRAFSAFEAGRTAVASADDSRIFENTIIDVMRQMAIENPAEFRARTEDPEENAKMLQEARDKARNLYLVRSLATFIGPAAPSFTFTAEDENGTMWAYNALANEYRRLLDLNEGDSAAASAQFIQAFGFAPAPLATPKTKSTQPRSTSEIGNSWQRANPELFDAYPGIAFYLGPARFEEISPFDYQAYQRQIREGTREPLNQDEWQVVLNDFYGRTALDERRNKIEQMYGRPLDAPGWDPREKEQAQQALRNYKWQLVNQFPGYQPDATSGLAGIPGRIDTNQQISQFQKLLENRPDLITSNEAVAGVAEYMAYREAARLQAQKFGYASFATGGAADAKSQEGKNNYVLRQWLRNKGDEITRKYPDFAPVWDDVFSREMMRDDEDMDEEAAIAQIAGGT